MTAAKSYEIEVEDVVYGRPGGVELMARIFRPKGEGPYPGVVEVHGGAWSKNDRFTNIDIHQPLAASGVVVMAIDFRMPPKVQYPEPISDINRAVRWMKTNAGAYGVDPAKVGMLGTSSGGHQGMLAAMRPNDRRYRLGDELPAEVDATVAFAAVCWGVLDPFARFQMVTDKGIERLVEAHNAYWPSVAAMQEGNPQMILDRGEPASLPPALLIQGTADDNLLPDMAQNFQAAYTAAGGAARYEAFEGAPHAFIAADPESDHAKRAIAMIIEFVQERANAV